MAIRLTIEALKFLLPAIVLFFAVRLAVKAYLGNEELKRKARKDEESSKVTLPLHLQAYERLVLLLERITPAQVLNRFLQPGMTVYQIQKALIQNIREEFEHNVSQQIYISNQSWVLIRAAKEEIILLINTSAAETENEDATVFARKMLENWGDKDSNPIQAAIEHLKKEVEQIG